MNETVQESAKPNVGNENENKGNEGTANEILNGTAKTIVYAFGAHGGET